VAKRLHLSEFIIGATIVAVGTSMPELVVSVMSAINGSSEVSIGNVVGSNVFNIYAILGITCLITPLGVSRENIRRDIPIHIGVAALLCLLALDGSIWGLGENLLGRGDGILLLVLYVGFLWMMIAGGRRSPEAQPSTNEPEEQLPSMWLSVVMIVGGLVGLVWGADMFLDGAITHARRVGLSEAVIGIVLVAVGTSLPEFFASFVSAIKGKSGIALGNLVGSNIANILLILGTSATIAPLRLGNVTMVDMVMMFSTSVALLAAVLLFGRGRIGRVEGALFLTIYVVYTISLLR
jgi:cation:H+ antiporter